MILYSPAATRQTDFPSLRPGKELILLTRTEVLTDDQAAEVLSYSGSHLPVLFDIETTGLYWRTSHLYLLGLICRKKGQWILAQWFLDRPTEEKQILTYFSSYIQELREEGSDLLIHFNGTTFDLPYLAHKYAFYGMPDPFADWESLDIYRQIRPFQKLLGLPAIKQKSIEEYLCIPRRDEKSGGELISDYQSWLATRDNTLLDMLFLHNHDDVLGMLALVRILAIPELFAGEIRPASDIISKSTPGTDAADMAEISFSLVHPLPASLCVNGALSCLTAEKGKTAATLQIPIRQGLLKHFFSDYKNYYYLPLEDQAIHKSVAVFVDSSHRKKATARTCYIKAEGSFLPLPAKAGKELGLPLYQEEPTDKTVYIRLDDLASGDKALMSIFIRKHLEALQKTSG